MKLRGGEFSTGTMGNFQPELTGLPSRSFSSRSGCNFRAVKITVASKMACFRSSVMESPQLGLKCGRRQEKAFYTCSALIKLYGPA